MKKITAIIAAFVIMIQVPYASDFRAAAQSDAIVIYCAPDGDDAADGTVQNPLKTLDAAKKRVRTEKQKHPNTPIKVYLRGGIYQVSGTAVFSEADSGSDGAPVEYCAYGDEVPVFSGSVKVTNADFKSLSAGELLRTPKDAAEHIGVADLKKLGIKKLTRFEGYSGTEYVEKTENTSVPFIYNDTEQAIAQWPNGVDNFSTITEVVSGSKIKVDSKSRINFWTSATNAMIYGWMRYGYSFQRVAVRNIVPEENLIETAYDIPRGAKADGRWKIVNLLEELDTPGEYYVDTDDMKLYFYAPYEDGNADMQVSANEKNIIEMSDAHHITFRGISFKNTRSDAFEIRGGSNISILGCKFKNIALMAVDTLYTTDLTVDGCDFVSIGSTGVRIDERGDMSNIDTSSVRLDLTPDNNVVNNCYFYDVATQSVIYTGAIRLHGVGNKVTNCSIHEGRSSFIHHGGNDLEISHCELWNGLKTSRDMGMIYNGRNVVQRGNDMSYNYFHDWSTNNPEAGYAAGIYDDDCLTGNNKHHNIFANGQRPAHTSGAPDGHLDYNIMAANEDPSSLGDQGYSDGAWLTSMRNFVNQQVSQVYTLWQYDKYDNIKDMFFKSRWNTDKTTATGNLFYKNRKDYTASPGAMRFMDLSANISSSDDTYTKYFNDPENGDYTIKKDISVPDELKELQKIQLDDIGIYESENRKTTEYKLGDFRAYYPFKYMDDVDSKAFYATWEKSDNADRYIVEIASDMEFDNILYTIDCPFNFVYADNLDSGRTVYYWRVKAVSDALKNRETKMCTNDVMVFRTNMYDTVDTSLLAAQIEKAKAFANSVSEGTEQGKLAFGTLGELRTTITEAEKLVSETIGNQQEIDNYTMLLQNKFYDAVKSTSLYYEGVESVFADDAQWSAGAGTDVTASADEIMIKSSATNGMAAYSNFDTEMKYDTVKCLRLKPTVPDNSPGSVWQAFAFADETTIGKRAWQVSGSQSLMFVIKRDTVELQIRDGVNSALVLSEANPFVFGEYNDVQVGIINVGTAQRYLFTVNGTKVFDYTSDTARLTQKLYPAIYDAPKQTSYASTDGISISAAQSVPEPQLYLGNRDSLGTLGIKDIFESSAVSASGKTEYSQKKVSNDMTVVFDVTAEDMAAKHGIMFRCADNSGAGECYRLTFTQGRAVLSKIVSGGERILCIENYSGAAKMTLNQKNTTDGLKISLNTDGTTLIDFTDESPILGSGYFAVFSDGGQFALQ